MSKTRRTITIILLMVIAAVALQANAGQALADLDAPRPIPAPTTDPNATTTSNTVPLGDECPAFDTMTVENGPVGRWFTPGRHDNKPKFIVIHTTESDREPGAELNVASWLSRTDYHASSHFVVGPEASLLTVDIGDIAWGVGSSGNADGVQIELIGHAADSRQQWLQPEGRRLLCRAAALAATLSVTYDIPLRRVEATGVLDGISGVAGHRAFTLALGGSTHTDPGDNFPWDCFLAQAAGYLDAARLNGPMAADVLKPDVPSGDPTGQYGFDQGMLDDLAQMQAILSQLNDSIDQSTPR